MTSKPKTKRGFAAMTPERRREIARKGGQAAQAKGTAHRYTTETGKASGRKGGQAAHAKGTAHKFAGEEAIAAGRKGGQATRAKREGRAEVESEREAAYAEHTDVSP